MVLLVAASARVFAQETAPRVVVSSEEADPADSARFHFGPIRFTPTISVTNLGVNNNVFNETSDPKSDTTAAVGPAVNLWMKVGRSRVSGKSSGQYLYFEKYDNQRAWGTTNEARWEVPLGRITPFATGAYANTRQQQGYEIDIYTRQRTQNVGAGADLQLGGKTKVTLGGSRGTVLFDEDTSFLGVGLAGVLNSTTDKEELQVRYKLTPLTTFVVSGVGVQDRFEHEPIRNANSVKVLPGFEFKPFALISGTAAVGYRWFSALDPAMPDYHGIIASVDARYAVARSQLSLKVSRDLQYSFEVAQPYYALTDVALSVTERVTTTWDFVARGGLQSLDYAEFATALTPGGRVDNSRQVGGGIGYRVGRYARIGFDATYYRRVSANASRDYEGFRSGVSISYGTQP